MRMIGFAQLMRVQPKKARGETFWNMVYDPATADPAASGNSAGPNR